MRNLLLIGHHDVRMFLRNKSSYLWLAIMPVLFIYFTGAANKGPGDPANPRPSVRLENHDTNFLSQALLKKLDAAGMNILQGDDKGTAERGIRIPADFTTSVLARHQTKIEFYKLESSGDQSAAMIEIRLLRAVVGLNSDLVQLASRGGNQPITEEGLANLEKQPKPVVLDASFAGRNPVPSGFNQSLPGNVVMFLMINLLVFGGASISGERAGGVMRRLAVQPLSRFQLVMGKVYGRFLLGALQAAWFLFAGAIIFKMNLGYNLPAIYLALLVFCWVAASLGVLIGSLITGHEKTVGTCVLFSMVMGALGGCWWPLEIVPDSMKLIGHFFPTAWAMDVLHKLISYGGNFGDVLVEVAVLCGFAVAANLAAAKFFRV